MNDLISRSALMELAHNHVCRTVDCNDIARFPAVDAVEVVRCKDCAHGLPSRFCIHEPAIMICTHPKLFPMRTNEDFFCSFGERKMDAEVEG